MPYEHAARQRVVYTTEPGEFSALCPFSGLPDSGTVRIEYVPGSWLLELKSLKYYLVSWRHIGAAQEDVTALLYEDLARWLGRPRPARRHDRLHRPRRHPHRVHDRQPASRRPPVAGGDGAAR